MPGATGDAVRVAPATDDTDAPLARMERYERAARYRVTTAADLVATLALQLRDAPGETAELDVQRLASAHLALDASWVHWRILRTQLRHTRAAATRPPG